jgi:hypothetical protein
VRIMISSRRGAGHVGPLIPFAKAFLRDNDEVVVVAPRSAAATIAAAGLDHVRYPDPPEAERSTIIAGARQMSFDDASERVLSEIFIRIDTRHAYPHVLAAMRDWRPDAILYEISEFAAPLAAQALGIPAVCVGITMGLQVGRWEAAMARELNAIRAEIGLRPDPDLDMLHGAPHFTLTPAELEDPTDPSPVQAMRFREDDEPPRPLPDWWNGSGWPLVYLTFGSVAPTMDFFPGLYREALDALALLPVRVLLTIGRDRDPRELGRVAPNVHVARWVPQADVMPTRRRWCATGARARSARASRQASRWPSSRCSPTSPTTPIGSPASGPASHSTAPPGWVTPSAGCWASRPIAARGSGSPPPHGACRASTSRPRSSASWRSPRWRRSRRSLGRRRPRGRGGTNFGHVGGRAGRGVAT